MMDKPSFTQLALSFPNTEQTPHFDRAGFRITGKRMFCTYLEKDNTANIFLTSPEQKVFCQMDAKNIYPVKGKWGEKGATTFDLNKVKKEFVTEALLSAYNEILKKTK